VHLLDDGLGEAIEIEAPNGATLGATQDPKTAATPTPLPTPDPALESESAEQPQAAADALACL